MSATCCTTGLRAQGTCRMRVHPSPAEELYQAFSTRSQTSQQPQRVAINELIL